jgi:chromosome segregation ATPase
MLTVAAAFTVGASTQPAATTVDPLAALLAEVHALRVAMEQQASIGPRVQLTLARLTIEEQRVSHLVAELSGVRQQVSGTELGMKRVSDELADVEQRLVTEADPVKRRELEAGKRGAQFQIRQFAAQLEQVRAHENDAAQALASEQARWVELNSRLDELERLLTPVR